MKTVVEKIRTIVRLEYKFNDDYINYDHIDCVIDDWTMVMTSLWESYFGGIGDYHDVLEIIMGCKEVEWDQEQAVDKLLDYYTDQALEDSGYDRYYTAKEEEERKLYHDMLAKQNDKLGNMVEDLLELKRKAELEKQWQRLNGWTRVGNG